MVLTGNLQLRDYQLEIIEKGTNQIMLNGWCYLSMEVRTGKTLTSLGIAKNINANRIVFVTKKKAIPSIKNDAKLIDVDIEAINYESLHKLEFPKEVDLWILDEAHCLGAFPKPSKRTKQLKEMIRGKVIFLSGTPTPETTSQIFHQMYVLGSLNPFTEKNFYQWGERNCNIQLKYLGHSYPVKDYSDCKFDINKLNFISYSQKEAGFQNEIKEHFIKIEMKPITKTIIETLKRDKVFKGKSDVILADTSAKEMMKVHQLGSGTCLLESGNTSIIDTTKADFIADNFTNHKVAIFYKFKAELEMIKSKLNITEDIEEFNNSDKHIALQFVSGREGIKLSKADMIVAFNIDFSATTYFQFRDRMTTINRQVSDVYWLFSDCGIENKIYNVVKNKKNFTLQYYERTRLSK